MRRSAVARTLNVREVRIFPRCGETRPERTRDQQYEWLRSVTDPASGLEKRFLEFLYENGYRLPDAAQNRPDDEVPAQPDFYYSRDRVPGVCVFVDGSEHDEPRRQERDSTARSALEDRGYRVIAIRFDQSLEAQVQAHPDVFGSGNER